MYVSDTNVYHEQPMDYTKGVHRGFAFVEYDDADDAAEAIFNMDGSDLLQRTISVSLAQPNQVHKLTSGTSAAEAVWKSDEWFQKAVGQDSESLARQRDREVDAKTLQDM
jgi:peptidyl-prolyl isomerase E (cyclophilin E)